MLQDKFIDIENNDNVKALELNLALHANKSCTKFISMKEFREGYSQETWVGATSTFDKN